MRDAPNGFRRCGAIYRLQLNRKKHPFYEHSDADFFIAVQDGKDVGRIAVLENKPYNQYHNRKLATFFLFETINDPQVSSALFERRFPWAAPAGLDSVHRGPKGFGPLDGYGMLVDGFEHRQTMMMSSYNHAYYRRNSEHLGFQKEVDFISCSFPARRCHSSRADSPPGGKDPKTRHLLSARFQIQQSDDDVDAPFIDTYNKAFTKNWEYYPLSQREAKFVADNIFQLISHDLMKIITHGEEVGRFRPGVPGCFRGTATHPRIYPAFRLPRRASLPESASWISFWR